MNSFLTEDELWCLLVAEVLWTYVVLARFITGVDMSYRWSGSFFRLFRGRFRGAIMEAGNKASFLLSHAVFRGMEN